MSESFPLVTERIVPAPFRHYPLVFWFSAFLVAAAVSVALGWQVAERGAYWGLTLPQALGLFTVPLVFKYCHLQFIDWSKNASSFLLPGSADPEHEDVRLWLARELRFFSGSLPMYLFALMIAIVATLVFYFTEKYLENTAGPAKFAAFVVIFVSAFPAGLGLYVMFSGLRMLRRLGQFRARVSPHKFGVRSTGIMLVKILVVVSLAWSGYVASAVFGIVDFAETWKYLKLPMLLLVIPTFFFFIAAFVSAQFPLHRRMVEFKREELFKVEQVLHELNSVEYGSLAIEDKAKIDFYERKKEDILGLPEWPFGLRSLLGMFTSTIAVLWPTLISPFLPEIARMVGSMIQSQV